jgi:hypothetical protein
MRRIAPGSAGLAGLLLGLGLGLLLFRAEADLPSMPRVEIARAFDQEAVLIVAVETPENLAVVRRAVSADRLVASSEHGFAIEPRRLVVTRLERAGDLLGKAGWSDRPLEIVHVGPRERESAQAGRLSDVAELVDEPTLTMGEAYRLLGTL